LQLDKFISELLFENECVIIPDFGGFIINYKPALIQEDVKRISPPSVEIAFNPILKNNDGLLAYHISAFLKISFPEAIDQIALTVSKWNYFLANGEPVFLKDIGELQMNDDEKIIFTPCFEINYLRESYGLFPVDIKLVNRRQTALHPDVFKQLTIPVRKRKKPMNILVYSLTAYIPVLILLWAFLMINEPFNQTNLGTLNVLTRPGITIEKQHTKTSSVVPVDRRKSNKNEPASENNIENYTVKNIYIDDAVTRKKGLKPAYHIVAGSFATYKNAVLLKKELAFKHFKSEILDTGDGKYRVTYNHFEFGEEAVNYLKEIREKENTTAWIIKQ